MCKSFIGVAGAGVAGQVGEAPDEAAAEVGGGTVRRVVGVRELDRGADEWVGAHRARLICQRREQLEQPRPGSQVGPAQYGLRAGSARTFGGIEILEHERVLAGEVLIERALGDARRDVQVVHRCRVDPALGEQRRRRLQDPLMGTAAERSVRADRRQTGVPTARPPGP